MKSGDQKSTVATSEFEQTEVFPFSTIDIGLLRRWKSDETWDQDSTALISEVLEHRERLLKLVDQIQSNLSARAEMIIEIERVTSQLSRRMNISLPASIRSNYPNRPNRNPTILSVAIDGQVQIRNGFHALNPLFPRLVTGTESLLTKETG